MRFDPGKGEADAWPRSWRSPAARRTAAEPLVGEDRGRAAGGGWEVETGRSSVPGSQPSSGTGWGPGYASGDRRNPALPGGPPVSGMSSPGWERIVGGFSANTAPHLANTALDTTPLIIARRKIADNPCRDHPGDHGTDRRAAGDRGLNQLGRPGSLSLPILWITLFTAPPLAGGAAPASTYGTSCVLLYVLRNPAAPRPVRRHSQSRLDDSPISTPRRS